MSPIRWTAVVSVLAVGTAGAAAHAEGDVKRGAAVFQQCAACHSVEPGRHLTGPSLAKVWGAKAGSAEGFRRYSEALLRSGIVWNQQSLDRWLTKPDALVAGTAMAFPGIPDAKAREDVIAYLKAVSEGKAPAPAGRGGMMGGGMSGGMMGSAEPDDLRKAGADAQVVSIQHCRDAYVVRTRDGKVHRIWEYNLRLKTDSSERGPGAGTPVVVGSGMRGDRFSVVFAAPKDISRFIEERCEK